MNLRKELRRLAVLALFGVVMLGFTLPAHADSITVAGASDPNLQATINITPLSPHSSTFSAPNVLVAGVTSTITGIGFELPGVIVANSPGVCTGSCGNFTATP